jgi:hypothetical protein
MEASEQKAGPVAHQPTSSVLDYAIRANARQAEEFSDNPAVAVLSAEAALKLAQASAALRSVV